MADDRDDCAICAGKGEIDYYTPDRKLDAVGCPACIEAKMESEIAAATAAARAEGEKAGRAMSAVPAISVRNDCMRRIDRAHRFFVVDEEVTNILRRDIMAVSLPTDADTADATAILAAERAAGREEMRRACVTLVRQTNMVDSDPEGVADEIRALVLP